jgi:hypothetical protein
MIDKHPSRYKRRRVPTDTALPRLLLTPSLLFYTPRLLKASRMSSQAPNEEEELKLQGVDVLHLEPPVYYL